MMDTGPVPLGPDSLTWKYFGDWRGLLIALWAGSMQNMHPGLGAGVEQHSRFFEERWQRLFRSLYPIGGVVYDGPRAHRTALQVRGYHETIKGVDAQGRRYHALDPDTYYWAHATFFVSTLRIAEHFMGGLTEAQRRQLFDEHVQWYRMYDMSMRPVPETWEDFQRYWHRMCTEVLEDNKATRDVLKIGELPKPAATPWLPDALWRLVRPAVARGFVWLTVGMYDQPVRDLLGYRWSERDRWSHRVVGKAINAGFSLVPHDRRYHPRARAGWRRVTGKVAPDAPQVETPARNLPPLDRRDSPTHYSPQGARPADRVR
ncbi:oxygenase MpaB family protein [Amycolatopsis palatopharyngis]|uniref:oxygenase MpaB family protein n=1 Tax=Amycolatopsis palatopharyngis TaxID=187982 RepID=UPI0013BE9812|nr:oxygenase MpaB family protein [Amycolatopsis palatopharyngis]